MTQSIIYYVDVSVSLSGTGPQPAGFGVPMFVHQSNVQNTLRLHGPFTSLSGLQSFGYAVGSPPYLWATQVLAQSPRVRQFYVGRADAGDASFTASLNAIYNANKGAWHKINIENRMPTEIKALAAFTEAVPKIAIAQANDASMTAGTGRTYTITVGGTPADGNYDVIFTGFGLASPVTVRVTRSTTPATNDDLAAAIDAELDTQNAPAGDIEDLLVSVSTNTNVVTIQMTDDLDAGEITSAAPGGATITIAQTDHDLGTFLKQNNYNRTALAYHPTDSEYLDGAWTSRCGAFNLDVRKGIWAYKGLNEISGTNLDDAQVTALRAANVNYFSPAVLSAGTPVQAFTAQGIMASGRRIDITETMDWTKARIEEAAIRTHLSDPHGVPFDEGGINRYAAALGGVFTTGVNARHYIRKVVPAGEDYEGLLTPYILLPRLSEISAADRENRVLTFTAIAYLTSFVEKVVYNVELRL